MRKFVWGLMLLLLGVIIGFRLQPLLGDRPIVERVDKFEYVLQTAYKNYVEEIDPGKLTEAGITAALAELDVHSHYFPAKEMESINEDFQGSFQGIGIQFDIINDTITVVSPIPGGPSEMLGIMSGDKIVNIEGKSAIAIPRDDVPKKLRGKKGTEVTVDIYRNGSPKLLHFVITRDDIPIYTVDARYMIEGTDIGLIQVNRFAATTNKELLQALFSLQNKGMKRLILDLRGNPGGFLSQAYQMADIFLPVGDTIVMTKGRSPQFDDVFISETEGQFAEIPLIVLVDAGSASASEIVSGAIQDLDRGLVAGSTTYGKGLVQRQYDLGDGSSFRLSTSKYFTPSGRCIQRPYKDKEDYRNLIGRLELKEGNYIFNTKELIEKNLVAVTDSSHFHPDSLPVYHTRGGRIVLGGGGVTPDYIVKHDTINWLSRQIRSHNLFFEYVTNNLNTDNIQARYKDDFDSFRKTYLLGQAEIDDFKNFILTKDIEFDQSQWDTDMDYYTIALKAAIARKIWDRNSSLQVFMDIDRQLQQAITLFPQAKVIKKLSSQ